MFLLISLKFKS